MTKVLFITENLDRGGAEKVLVNLVNKMDKTKFDVNVLALYYGGVNEEDISPGVHYTCRKAFYFKGMSRLLRFVSPEKLYKHYVGKEKYDVVVGYMGGIATLVASGAPCKKIAFVHSDYSRSNTPTVLILGSDGKATACYKRFDRIACVSDYVKDTFVKRTGIKENVSVCHNVNDIGKILQLAEAPAPFELKKQEDELLLIGVGGLKKVKGFDRLLKVFARLKNEGFSARLLILGEGKERKNLQQLILENGLNGSVMMPGYVKNPYCFMKNADLFVCSSFSEGYSTAMTEAVILGLPCITTRVSGAEEILGTENPGGIITENSKEALYNGIKSVLSDENLRKKLKNNALIRAEFFKNQCNEKETEKIIEEI